MGTQLIQGDDGLVAEEVGDWVRKKHWYLREYLKISAGPRKGWIRSGKAGATFVDLFSSCGRVRLRESGEWLDGSVLVAWKASVASNSPFSGIFVADVDPYRREAALERLRRAAAPARGLEGDAVAAARSFVLAANPYALHFAFLDPYSLGALNFEIIRTLSRLKRIDILAHVSAMDLQRNLPAEIAEEERGFDTFAPGWRDNVDTGRPQHEVRTQVLEHWKGLVRSLEIESAPEARLITGPSGQRLYWLMLIARHELALKFWKVIGTAEGQREMF